MSRQAATKDNAMVLRILLAVTVIALSTTWAAASEITWRYPDIDAGEDFPKWGGICDTGRHQSPIDLSTKDALKGKYKALRFDNYDKKHKNVTMVNNGHSIQLSNFDEKMQLGGGPLNSDYIVEQIHLHWWSEHLVNNRRFPLEAHIVHRNKRYADIDEAVKHKDGLAVVGILYYFSNEENVAIVDILDNLDQVRNYTQINKPIKMKDSFVTQELFPIFNGYFTYEGSLTTPSCAEVVTWFVMYQTFPVTVEQVQRFQEIEFEQGKFLTNNYRLNQKINYRPVILDLRGIDNERNAANSLPSSSAALLTAILAMVCVKLLN